MKYSIKVWYLELSQERNSVEFSQQCRLQTNILTYCSWRSPIGLLTYYYAEAIQTFWLAWLIEFEVIYERVYRVHQTTIAYRRYCWLVIKSLTRFKVYRSTCMQLVSTLNRLGHCISKRKLQEVETALADVHLQKQHANLVRSNIVPNVPVTFVMGQQWHPRRNSNRESDNSLREWHCGPSSSFRMLATEHTQACSKKLQRVCARRAQTTRRVSVGT